ncbi:MAG: lytic murein transglycosylase [Parcubacteria group bacterium]
MEKRRKIFVVFLLMLFATVGVFGFSRHSAAADTASSIRDDIEKYNKKLEVAQQELATQQSQLYKNQSKIAATKKLIASLTADISKKEAELKELNSQADANKNMLSEYIRQIYYIDQEDILAELPVTDGNLSDLSSNFDGMLGVKAKIIASLETINNTKDQVEQVKLGLADLQKNNAQALAVQQAQQAAIASDVQETQATVAELQAKLNKLRSTLSNFLGESFTMDDVIEAVKYAEKKTGVRKEFLFAVLDKETDLGRFTGGCTYDKSKMGSTNLAYFKEICDDLGYNYKKMKVSCALSYGIGGAMGVAQFMPSTWMGYKDGIASRTGNDPADPWSLKDGIMGMALYLKNKGGDSKGGEYQAAAMYYCGGNWKRTVCKNYANTVISWSKGYDSYF